MPAALPAYDKLQSAFHRTFRRELTRALRKLPVPAGGKVLDAPCGGGFYARRLAARVGPGGTVTAADLDPAYLERALRRLAPVRDRADVVKADVYALPFPAGAFDLVWCGQSFITLTDHASALAEFARVTRPGGTVAVFESDEYHYVLLPWPVTLEVSLQAALAAGCRAKYGRAGKLAAARKVRAQMRAAGLTGVRKRTVTADRNAPFGPAERTFLKRHFAHTRTLVAAALTPAELAAFDAFATPGSGTSVFDTTDAEFTCLTTVHTGRA